MLDCVFCDRTPLLKADVYIENEWCVYASSRDPRDPPEVLPGSGIIVTKAHRSSPFDFTSDEWAAVHELLLKAKAIQDECLNPDGTSCRGHRSRRLRTTCRTCTRIYRSARVSQTSPGATEAVGSGSKALTTADPTRRRGETA
jgi:hypothetical protein